MQSDKLQQITLEFHIDLADTPRKDAQDLCRYIQDYILKHYNTINCDCKVIDGE